MVAVTSAMSVRSFAALSLGLINDPGSVSALATLVSETSDSDKDLKVCAIVALGLTPHHRRSFDLFIGVFKSLFFGATIAILSCYRGFHCSPGAEGVGRAATSAFVQSFVVILILDLFLGIFLDAVYNSIWPDGVKLFS